METATNCMRICVSAMSYCLFNLCCHPLSTSDLVYAFTEVDARLPDHMHVVRRISRILGLRPRLATGH